MKKVLLAAILMMVLSCTTDRNQEENNLEATSTTDPNPSGTKNSILGIWKLDSTSKISGTDQKTVISTEVPGACSQLSTFEYKESNIYLSNGYYLEKDNQCVPRAYKAVYNYKPEQKTLQIDGMLAKVTELSERKLILLDQMNADYNGDGVDDYIQINYSR